MNPLKLCLAQLDFTVGAIRANTEKMLAEMAAHADHDVIIFPELAVTGYPPEDLLFRRDMAEQVAIALAQIQAKSGNQAVVVGHPQWVGEQLFNAVSVFANGECLARYHKQRLPNYGVFDEQRYFIPDQQNAIFEWRGHRIGLLICEDIWHPAPLAQLTAIGIDWVITINASPFEYNKHEQRMGVLQQRAHESGCPIVYVNNCGGQDELVFDGHSLITDGSGELVVELPHAQVGCFAVTLVTNQDRVTAQPMSQNCQPRQRDERVYLAEVYAALVLSVRDYVQKNGFKGVALGLSGGIDSALTLAIAVDALGAEHVTAVMMPYKYTSSMSLQDAETQAKTQGVDYQIVAIEPMVEAFKGQLSDLFDSYPSSNSTDTTIENLQARCRGMVLMALSNRTGKLVLTTSNKSETAVGYATLYGDMCGGYAPIKDAPKMLVYELARYCNREQEVIPARVIERPPSAELAPDQIDEASLMPYAELDKILSLYLEQDWSLAEITAVGFAEADVRRILDLVDINEYKRRQAAIGPKLTSRNFGRDRRYPITSHWRYQR